MPGEVRVGTGHVDRLDHRLGPGTELAGLGQVTDDRQDRDAGDDAAEPVAATEGDHHVGPVGQAARIEDAADAEPELGQVEQQLALLGRQPLELIGRGRHVVATPREQIVARACRRPSVRALEALAERVGGGRLEREQLDGGQLVRPSDIVREPRSARRIPRSDLIDPVHVMPPRLTAAGRSRIAPRRRMGKYSAASPGTPSEETLRWRPGHARVGRRPSPGAARRQHPGCPIGPALPLPRARRAPKKCTADG